MNNEKYNIAGVALPRAPWFGRVSQWSVAGVLPIEFVKCLSTDEIRARLESNQQFSAVVVDSQILDRDRDLISVLKGRTKLIAVSSGDATLDHKDVISIESEFDRELFSQLLAEHCKPTVIRNSVVDLLSEKHIDLTSSGKLFLVTGAGGTGVSTIAMALAQSLAEKPEYAGNVLLVDGKRSSELAMYHDSGDVTPGIEELLELVRNSRAARESIRNVTFHIEQRGYNLLLGMRRPSAWNTLTNGHLTQMFDALTAAFSVVVVDAEADFEGRDDCGSFDVEERNGIARIARTRAHGVFLTGLGTMKGSFSQAAIAQQLIDHGTKAETIAPVQTNPTKFQLPLLPQKHALPDALSSRSMISISYLRNMEQIHRDVSVFPPTLIAGLKEAAAELLERDTKGELENELEAI